MHSLEEALKTADPNKIDRWILRLGKNEEEAGKFEPWHCTAKDFKEDFDGFLTCLALNKLLDSVKERISLQKRGVRAAKKEMKAVQKEIDKAAAKVKKETEKAQKKLDRAAERERIKQDAKAAREAAKYQPKLPTVLPAFVAKMNSEAAYEEEHVERKPIPVPMEEE